SRTLVYKGLMAGTRLADFYLDLRDPACESRLAVFHQRYSTNTMPDWRLAQPFRMLAHNGEINTVTGNRAWMRAREAELELELRGVIWPEGSDSASLDNALELLVHRGWEVSEALMSLVPDAWEGRGAPCVRLARRPRSGSRREAPRRPRTPGRPRHAARPARLGDGGREVCRRGDGRDGGRARLFDGRRYPDRAARPNATPRLRLLAAAVRAGHQPGDRPAAREGGDVAPDPARRSARDPRAGGRRGSRAPAPTPPGR